MNLSSAVERAQHWRPCSAGRGDSASIPSSAASAQRGRGDGASHPGSAAFAQRASAQRGYTLIEVIVAFALLAFALTLLLGTLTGSTKQVRWAADAGRAALHAQSLLDRTGVGEALQASRTEGDFEDGRYRWTLEISPYVDPSHPAPAAIDPGAAELMELVLAVRWGNGEARERLDLRSLRLVTPDATQPVALP